MTPVARYLSKCCAAAVEVQGGVTQWWQCTKCRNPCDAVQDVRETGYEGRHAKPTLRCQHCNRDIFPVPAGPRGEQFYEDSDHIALCMNTETGFVFHKPLPEI